MLIAASEMLRLELKVSTSNEGTCCFLEYKKQIFNMQAINQQHNVLQYPHNSALSWLHQVRYTLSITPKPGKTPPSSDNDGFVRTI